MPIATTPRMRKLQARWLTDVVRLHTATVSVDVDPDTLQPTTTETDVWEGCALLRQELADRDPGEGRVFGVRVLTAKLDADADPYTGMRLEVVASGDHSLVGKFGTIVDVDRDSIRVVRRCTVRMDNSE